MARGPQAGVGRFPAISQALSPSLSPTGLCLRLGLRHGAGMGREKEEHWDMLTPQACPAGMQANSHLSARRSLSPMWGAGMQPCLLKVYTRDQFDTGADI